MRTVFFEKSLEIPKDFKWKDIFSEATMPHTKEQRTALLVRGIGDNVPTEASMLREWQKPWLFARFAIVSFLVALLGIVSYNFFPAWGSDGIMAILCAMVVPMAVMIFYWEMNIKGNISLYQVLLYVVLGGLISSMPIPLVREILPEAYASGPAFLGGPIPEEITKLIAVLILISSSKHAYGVQGILIGGAVGCGFSWFESAGYALQALQGGGLGGAIENMVTRSLLAIGGHVLWAAMYGGAIGLAKEKGQLKIKTLMDPLVVLMWCCAVFLHTIWNLSSLDLIHVVPDSFVMTWNILESYYIKYIVLIIVGWALLLIVMRKSVRQMVAVAAAAAPESRPTENRTQAVERTGAATVSRAVTNGVTGGKTTGKTSGKTAPFHPAADATTPAKTLLVTVEATGSINTGQKYPFYDGDQMVFGRDASTANVVLPPGTGGISRVHCEIKQKEGYIVIIDRGSSYGTFFENGMKLEPNVPYVLKRTTVFYLAAKQNQFTVRF